MTSEDELFEHQLAKKQKFKHIIAVLIAVLAIAGGICAYFFWPTPPPKKCVEKDVDALLGNSNIGIGAIHMVCDFPAPLEDTLKKMEASPPTIHPLLVMKMAAEAPELVMSQCPGYARAMIESAKVRREEQSALFLEKCNLKDTAFASASELSSAPLYRIILAIAVYEGLKESDGDSATRLSKRILLKP